MPLIVCANFCLKINKPVIIQLIIDKEININIRAGDTKCPYSE